MVIKVDRFVQLLFLSIIEVSINFDENRIEKFDRSSVEILNCLIN